MCKSMGALVTYLLHIHHTEYLKYFKIDVYFSLNQFTKTQFDLHIGNDYFLLKTPSWMFLGTSQMFLVTVVSISSDSSFCSFQLLWSSLCGSLSCSTQWASGHCMTGQAAEYSHVSQQKNKKSQRQQSLKIRQYKQICTKSVMSVCNTSYLVHTCRCNCASCCTCRHSTGKGRGLQGQDWLQVDDTSQRTFHFHRKVHPYTSF